MSEYKLKSGELAEAVIGVFKAIRDAVVENYKKIDDAFMDAFLERAYVFPEDSIPVRDK